MHTADILRLFLVTTIDGGKCCGGGGGRFAFVQHGRAERGWPQSVLGLGRALLFAAAAVKRLNEQKKTPLNTQHDDTILCECDRHEKREEEAASERFEFVTATAAACLL